GPRPVTLNEQCSSLGHMSPPCVTPGEKHRPLVIGRAELDVGFPRVEGEPSALRQRHMDGGGALKERGAGPPVEFEEFAGCELPPVGDTLATDADAWLGAGADDGCTPARRWGVAGVLDAHLTACPGRAEDEVEDERKGESAGRCGCNSPRQILRPGINERVSREESALKCDLAGGGQSHIRCGLPRPAKHHIVAGVVRESKLEVFRGWRPGSLDCPLLFESFAPTVGVEQDRECDPPGTIEIVAGDSAVTAGDLGV